MNKKILIIDDNARTRKALIGALEIEGYQLDEADTVREGLVRLNDDPQPQDVLDPQPRVIILDLDFPDAKGNVFLDKLKERATNRIIVYTGHPELLRHDTARDRRVFTYLGKDGNLEPLKFAIDRAFEDIEAAKLRKRIAYHLEIQRAINSPEVDSKVLNRVCSYARELTGSYTCHIRLLDLRKGDYELQAYDGTDDVQVISNNNKKLNEYFSGKIAQLREKRLYQDIQADDKFQQFKQKRLSEPLSEKAKNYLETIRSAYIIPIKTGLFDDWDQVDAVFNISGAEKDFFTPERIEVVDEFVTQVNLAISKKFLEEKREEIHLDYKNSNALLVEISEIIQKADVQQIYAIVLERIAKIINPEMISLFLYEESTGRVENKAEYVGGKMRYDNQESYAPGQCLTGYVFASEEPHLDNDDPTKHELYSSDEEIDCLDVPSRRIEHYMAVPLKAGNRVIGVIRAINKKSAYYDKAYPKVAGDDSCLLSRGFSRDCNIILGIIASHLAVTIKNLQLIKQSNALANVGQSISANYGLETENLLGLIVKETATVMNAATCMLFLTDEEKGIVELKQCYGIEHIPKAYYRLGEKNTGQVAQTGVPIYKEKADKYLGKYDKQILKRLKKKYGEQTKITSFMIAPIIIQDDPPVRKNKIIGVLKVINKRPDHLHFDAYDLSLFEIFASQISVAMVMSERNRALFKLTQGVGHEIENSVNLIVPDAEMSNKTLASFAAVFQKGRAVTERMREEYSYLREMVANIYESAEEARDFTRDLLGFSDKKFEKRKKTDINALLKPEVLKFINHPPPSVKNAKQVDLTFDLAPEPMVCNIYKIPFIHVVRNIVANAYQAMQSKSSGTLLIKTYLKEYEGENKRRTACIDFTDTGKGIKASKLSKVYNPDFSERKGGNGLGLWLVKLSLLRMDAAISVKSVVDQGTTFTVELPLLNSMPKGAVADGQAKKGSGNR